jgi:hypothetical protein
VTSLNRTNLGACWFSHWNGRSGEQLCINATIIEARTHCRETPMEPARSFINVNQSKDAPGLA